MRKALQRLIHTKPQVIRISVLYSLLIIGVLGIITITLYLNFSREIVERTTEYTAQLLSQAQKTVESNLHNLDQLSKLILSNQQLQEYLSSSDTDSDFERRQKEKEIEKICVDFMVIRNDILSVGIYTLDGYYISSDGTRYLGEQPEEVYEKALQNKGRTTWIFDGNDWNSVLAARIIYDIDVQPLGMLVITYDRIAFESLYQDNLNRSIGDYFILDENGVIISTSHPHLMNTVFEISLMEPSENKFVSAELYGTSCKIMVFDSEYNNWTYLCAVPSQALSPDIQTILSYCLRLLVIFCIVSVIIAIFIARRMTRPINQLTAALQNIDIQDLHFEQYSETDEFTYLFKAYNEMLNKIRQLIHDNYEQKILQNEIQIKMLNMQIHPHFLYNTLDSIRCLAIKNQDWEVSHVIKALADMMRYNLSGSDGDATVSGELQHAENYLAIQKVRMGSNLEYYIDVDDCLLSQRLPKMSIQPFLGNCIKHSALKSGSETLVIEVSGFRKGSDYLLQIIDNGGGMTQETAQHLTQWMGSPQFDRIHGIALPNINERIRRKFGEQYGIRIDPQNAEGGATFQILLPFSEE